MRNLKIVMVTDCAFPAFGGIESHIHYLAKALSSNGHEIYVLTHYSRNDRGNKPITIKNDYYTLIKLPGYVFYRFGADISFSLYAYYRMRELISQIKPDIIHGHSVLSMLVYQAMYIARTMNIPFVITKHSLIFRLPDRIRQIIIDSFNPLSLFNRYIGAYMGVSGSVLEEIPEKMGRHRVIFNGLDRDEITPKRDIQSIRQEMNIESDDKVIGFVSRLIKQKGIYDFIDTIKLCIDSGMSVKGIIVGDGPEYRNLCSYIKRLGLINAIEMTGRVEHNDIGDYFQIFDYFFLPSYSEGLGIVLLEAMLFDALVLTYDTGGTSEIVHSGRNGYLVKNSIEAAERIMNTSIEGPVYKKLVSQGRKTAADFTWNNVAKKVDYIYREFVN